MEYMDYNLDDSYKTKGQKIRSWIIICISVAWVVFLITWAIVRSPINTRSLFHTQTSKSYSFSMAPEDSTKNEFLNLYNTLPSGIMTIDAAFNDKYPEVSKLFMLDKEKLSSSIPFAFDKNGYYCLVVVYMQTAQEQYRNMDVLMIPHKQGLDENTLRLSVGAPIRFSIKYNTIYHTMRYQPMDEKLFKLNFYKLQLVVDAGSNIKGASYNLSLSSPVLKKHIERRSFEKIISINGFYADKNILTKTQYAAGDTAISKAFSENFFADKTSYKLLFKFNDLIYDKLADIELSTNVTDTKNAKYSIIVN